MSEGVGIERKPGRVFRGKEGHLFSVVLWPVHREPRPQPTARPAPPWAVPGSARPREAVSPARWAVFRL